MNTIKRSLLPTLTFIILFSASINGQQCLEDRYSQFPIFTSEALVQNLNVEYGQATNLFSGQLESLQLDVWEPNQSIDQLEERPLIVWIHGGSFQSGNRTDMNNLCEEFASRGYVAATISYRLGWECDPDAGLLTCALCGDLSDNLLTAAYCSSQDLRAALRYLVENAEEYGIDTDWIFLGGLSAGSISALSVAFMDQAEADLLLPQAVQAAGPVDLSGNDLTNTYDIKGVINDCGAVFDASVITEEDQMPVISFHDEFDCIVPYGNGRVLNCFGCSAFPFVAGSSVIHSRLQELNECSELNTIPLSPSHCSWPEGNLAERGACFLKRIMCEECNSGTNNNIFAGATCNELFVEAEPVDESCPEDLNGDGVINTGDLTQLLSVYGGNCN